MTPDGGAISHLEELRRRLIYALLAWAAGFAACYAWTEQLFDRLSQPVYATLPEGSSMVFIDATEPFFTYLKVAALAGFLVALPIILWQVWCFIAPGLYRHEKILAIPFVLCGCLCFGFGAWFGFTYVFPQVFKFLIQFGTRTGSIEATLSMGRYLSLSTRLLIAFGLVFEMPIISFFLARLGMINGQMLAKYRRYSIVFAFVFGATLTPPDLFSQIAIGASFVVLYEVSIIVARISYRKRSLEEEEEPASA